MLVDAVAGIKVGVFEPANAYVRMVRQHRGVEVAKSAQKTLMRYSESEAFEDVHMWPAWGYQSKKPRAEPKPAAPTKRKRKS